MIFKVQTAINREACLLYNEDKSIFTEYEGTDSVDIREHLKMKRGEKAFWKGRHKTIDGYPTIEFIKKVGDRDW